MSDSEEDSTLPSDSIIEDALRAAVRKLNKEEAEVTVNGVRSRAEDDLGLDAGTLKNDAWKKRSADVIKSAFEEPTSPEQPKKSAPKPKAGSKRKSDEVPATKNKRRKQSPVLDSEDSGDASVDEAPAAEEESDASEADPPTEPVAKSKSTSALSSPPDSDVEEPPHTKINGKKSHEATANDDESDMSSVIDDPPPKKKRGKKSDAEPSKAKPERVAKPAKASKPEKNLSPDDQEIKRLQGWLLKCGIRKLWHRELADCSTSKEKIKHLKGMLDEVGMTGRYSAEKAKQIKEQRELKAELEAAKEFNEKWGHEEDEDEESGGQRKGRLKPKGLVDFGDSGEDSD